MSPAVQSRSLTRRDALAKWCEAPAGLRCSPRFRPIDVPAMRGQRQAKRNFVLSTVVGMLRRFSLLLFLLGRRFFLIRQWRLLRIHVPRARRIVSILLLGLGFAWSGIIFGWHHSVP